MTSHSWNMRTPQLVCFRPLIRGFFFYALDGAVVIRPAFVSVPSFGDSFFIRTYLVR